jgi:PAS domain S-box-containing protein
MQSAELLSLSRALTVTDPGPDPESDEIVRYVAGVCHAPSAVLALIGRRRVWFKCRLGVTVDEAPQFTVPADLEVVEEPGSDPERPRHPLLTLVPGAAFLAIAPLRDGAVDLGVLAVFDRKPRTLAPHQVDALRFAATLLVGLLKVRRRVRLLETLVESTPDRFYAFDAGGRCLYASAGGARALGVEGAEMLGLTVQELEIHEDDRAHYQELIRLALSTGRLIEGARAIGRRSGDEHEEYAAAPLRGPRGEIDGVAITVRDVTERVAAETERRDALAKAQRAVRQRDDVLAVVSHDLGNMLNVFRLTSAALASGLPDDSEMTRERVDILQRQADSMRRLVEDLVDVGRIDAGRLRTIRADCKLRTIVDDALAASRPLAEQKGIALEVQVPDPDALVRCDRRRILQVFGNLLGNAVKFTDKGSIRIEVSAGEREVRFSIADTGSGMSPEHLPHLFERYWQAREGGRTGAGLGLYIAKGIVEAHGGRIWAESTPGKGTTISFTLSRSLAG